MRFKLWPAIQEKNLRWYLSGQSFSVWGTMFQNTAQSWLVWQISHSAYLTALNASLSTLPVAIFAPLGGALLDRWSIRRALITTQIVAMSLAFALGFIVLKVTPQPALWLINLFALLSGFVNAVDMPARDSFIAEIAHKDNIKSGTSASSTINSSSLVVGPACAGFLIPVIGIGWAFILNGVSFLGIITVLIKIKPEYLAEKCNDHPLRAVWTGVRYVFAHRPLLWLYFFSGATIMTGFSFRAILPVVSAVVYHGQAAVYGFLFAALGLGVMVGSYSVFKFGKAWSVGNSVAGGCLLMSSSLLIFSFGVRLSFGLCLMFLAGFGLMLIVPTLNATVLRIGMEQKMLGRLSSFNRVMLFGGLMSGGWLNGVLSEQFGPLQMIRMNGIASLLLVGIAVLYLRKHPV